MTNTMIEVPILTVTQPWAWLLIRPDILPPEEREQLYLDELIKNVENRLRSTRIRGWVGIQSGLFKPTPSILPRSQRDVLRRHGVKIPARSNLQYGGLIGRVYISDCLPPLSYNEGWRIEKQYGYMITDSIPLPFVSMSGMPGLFYKEVDRSYWNAGQSLMAETVEQAADIISHLNEELMVALSLMCTGQVVAVKKIVWMAIRSMGLNVVKQDNNTFSVPTHVHQAWEANLQIKTHGQTNESK